MKRVLAAFLVFSCLLVPAWAEDSGARFSDLSGQVEVRPDADEEAWSFAKLDMPLNVDDHVKTAERSSAILSFADMTTFVMKPESEIVLSSPAAKDSQIKLLAGNLWVNVKKMVKDGTMDIEMSQAVAGIKGTNITCQSNIDEDRISVLRGVAEVLIRESQEKITVNEGEELVVKKGGKTEKSEIDIEAEKKKWDEELSKMGANFELEEVPGIIQGLLQSEAENFTAIIDDFKALLALGQVPLEDAQEFIKSAERFTGVIMEDLLILGAMRMKIDKTLGGGGLSPSQLTQVAGYQKMVADAQVKIQGYQMEIAKMMKTKFKTDSGAGSEEIGQLQAELTAALEPVENILREVSANPAGLSQDWFAEALDQCTIALQELDMLSQEVQSFLDANPSSLPAQNMLKQIAAKQSQISNLLKDLAVVEIDGSMLTELQDIDDTMSDAILLLNKQIESYNTTVSGADAEKRLSASLSIMRDFSKSRRLYTNAQRLYDSTMRATAGQKFKTAEQEEMESIFDRIQNTYQQIGIGADLLESRLNDLESQLSQFLNSGK
ncbi:MAG: hypothetical protein GX442_05370 [Candidatus Riflebacteria bacterium]|nr:hypothetical protein [Candidatus Riflebacteria bacterium]